MHPWTSSLRVGLAVTLLTVITIIGFNEKISFAGSVDLHGPTMGIFPSTQGGTPTPTPANSVLVTNANNSGPGSLRQAIEDVPTDGIINFDSTFFSTPQTIALSFSDLAISRNMTINGLGANLITVAGPGNSRVFRVTATATINGLKITGGNSGLSNGSGISNIGNLTVNGCHITGNTANFGGGISNGGAGTLTLLNSTVSGNTSNDRGGGIDSSGTLIVTNSTISGNVSTDQFGQNGGGIWTRNATITNSTITNNTAVGDTSAAGLFSDAGTVTVRNSIIAGNVNNDIVPDVLALTGSVITSNGFNLIGNRGTVEFAGTADQAGNSTDQIDPVLRTLLISGGSTPTHALVEGSPAVDAGNSSAAVTDQRGIGFLRPVDLSFSNASGGDGSDIGAYEAQTEPGPAFANIEGRVETPTGLGLRSAIVSLIDSQGFRRTATTSSFGIFMFSNIPTGDTYIINVSSKRYRFASQALTFERNLSNIDFTGLE